MGVPTAIQLRKSNLCRGPLMPSIEARQDWHLARAHPWFARNIPASQACVTTVILSGRRGRLPDPAIQP